MKSFLISTLLLLLSIGAAITCSVYTDRFCNAVTELTERLPDDSELSEMGAIERGESSDAEMNFSADSSDALAALNELACGYLSCRRPLMSAVSKSGLTHRSIQSV